MEVGKETTRYSGSGEGALLFRETKLLLLVRGQVIEDL